MRIVCTAAARMGIGVTVKTMSSAPCTHTNIAPEVCDQTLGVVCKDCGSLLGACWGEKHVSEALWNRACKSDPECKPCEQNRDDVCFLCGSAMQTARRDEVMRMPDSKTTAREMFDKMGTEEPPIPFPPMPPVRFSDAKFSFNGIEFQAPDVSWDPPRSEVIPGTLKGQLAATLNFSPKFLRALDALQPHYRVQGGLVQVAGPAEVEFCPAGFAKPMRGLLWASIGTARSEHTQARLRKFVRRGNRLVEVRARGRTGHRTLRAAVEACGYEGCFMMS